MTLDLPASKRCPRCGFHKPPTDYYRRKNGQLESYCIECEAERRKQSSVDMRKRKKDEIKQLTPAIEKQILAELREHGNKSLAAKRTGVHRNTIYKVLKRHEGKLQLIGLDVAPDPIPYEKLSDEAKEALEDPGTFASRYIRDKDGKPIELAPWEVEAINESYRLYLTGEEEHAVLNAPPGSGKSTTVTFIFVAFVVCRERAAGREPTIHLGHRAESKAKWYLRRLAQLFTRNTKLIRDFGRFRPEDRNMGPWSNEELQVEPIEWETEFEKEPTLSIGSYEKGELSGRYKLIIWDDLIDKSNTLTAEAREKLVNWWETEAETRLEPGGLLILSNARYGPEDLSHHCLSQKDYEDEDAEDGQGRPLYRHIAFRAHDESKCDGENHDGPWPAGCLLDPRRLSWKRLRRQMIKNEGRFRLIYQQEDADPEGSLAEQEWFQGGEDSRGMIRPGCFDKLRGFGDLPRTEDKGGPPLLSAFTVDPSAANFWAVLHVLVYPNGDQVVLRGTRRRMSAPDLLYRESDGQYTGLLEEWWQLASQQHVAPRYWIVETVAQQVYLRQYEFVNTWAATRGVTIIPHDTSRYNKRDPELGVPTCGPVYREGRLRLPYLGHHERLFADQFQKEATAWPEGDTDDLVMAHWFFNNHYRRLIAVEEALRGEDADDDDVPEWALEAAPEWAKELVS